MKKLAIIIITVVFTGFSYGQQGKVTIEQDPKINRLLQVYTSANSNRDFYTIQVGFGSYNEAEKLKQDVEIDFPQWKAKIVFDSPTYRVRIGRFKTKLEAERHFQVVREKYQQSLILKSEKKEKS
ncbi:MAG: SPOR domain-containing protein [Flavobacteriaceae bacterium]